MTNRRREIAMTPEEEQAFILEGHTMQVASIGMDGRPHLVAMWYALLEGKIAFATYSKSQKVVNLRRDPRVTVMIEVGDRYDQVRGLVIDGEAEVIDGNSELAARVLAAANAHEPGKLPEGKLPGQLLLAASKRAVVVVHALSTYSWDHRKLGATN